MKKKVSFEVKVFVAFAAFILIALISLGVWLEMTRGPIPAVDLPIPFSYFEINGMPCVALSFQDSRQNQVSGITCNWPLLSEEKRQELHNEFMDSLK